MAGQMKRKKADTKRKTGEILLEMFYPLLFYYVMTVGFMLLAESFLGSDQENYMLCQTITAVISLPVMYLMFYRPDDRIWGHPCFCEFEQRNRTEDKILISRGTAASGLIRQLLVCALIGMLIGMGLNNLILMSPLPGMSAGYAEAAGDFYSGTTMIELLCSGFLMPVLEEMTYRGILYGRMRRLIGAEYAFFLSSLVFGIMHFNVVQFLYAFLMGMVFILLLEKTGKLVCTMAAHIAVNVLAVIRTETGFLGVTSDGTLFAWISSLIFLAIGIAVLVLFAGNLFRDLKAQIAWQNDNLEKKHPLEKRKSSEIKHPGEYKNPSGKKK